MIWFSNLFYYFAFLSSSFRVTISVSLSPISYFTVFYVLSIEIGKVETVFFQVVLSLSFLIVVTALVLSWLHFLMSLRRAYNLLFFLVGEFYQMFSDFSSSIFIFFQFYFYGVRNNYSSSILSLAQTEQPLSSSFLALLSLSTMSYNSLILGLFYLTSMEKFNLVYLQVRLEREEQRLCANFSVFCSISSILFFNLDVSQ